MKKVIKLNEKDLTRIVKRVIKENLSEYRYAKSSYGRACPTWRIYR